MASGGRALPPRVRRVRQSMVMTSLIDIIFLLVIFFMVSSQILPFSVLPVGPLTRGDGNSNSMQAESAASPVAVRVLDGRAMIGGTSMALGDLKAALDDLGRRGVTSILLMPSNAATVQDLVSALEAAKDASIANVTVLARQGRQP